MAFFYSFIVLLEVLSVNSISFIQTFMSLLIVRSWFRWLREDSSNMAVIDVKLVSGYQVDEESLDRVSYHGQKNSCESIYQHFY